MTTIENTHLINSDHLQNQVHKMFSKRFTIFLWLLKPVRNAICADCLLAFTKLHGYIPKIDLS